MPRWSWWASGPSVRSPGISPMTFHPEVFQGCPLRGDHSPLVMHTGGFLRQCGLWLGCGLVTCIDVGPRAMPWCLLQLRGLCGLRRFTDFPEPQVPLVQDGAYHHLSQRRWAFNKVVSVTRDSWHTVGVQ